MTSCANWPRRSWARRTQGDATGGQRGQREDGLHCACKFYTHPHSAPDGNMDCIAPASFTHALGRYRRGMDCIAPLHTPHGRTKGCLAVASQQLWDVARLASVQMLCKMFTPPLGATRYEPDLSKSSNLRWQVFGH